MKGLRMFRKNSVSSVENAKESILASNYAINLSKINKLEQTGKIPYGTGKQKRDILKAEYEFCRKCTRRNRCNPDHKNYESNCERCNIC